MFGWFRRDGTYAVRRESEMLFPAMQSVPGQSAFGYLLSAIGFNKWRFILANFPAMCYDESAKQIQYDSHYVVCIFISIGKNTGSILTCYVVRC